MKKNLLNKFFVFGVFVLFIGLSALSSGFSADAIMNSNEATLPDCETCNAGCDLELVEIIPIYKFHPDIEYKYLIFSCIVKNVGSQPCSSYGFDGYVYKFRTGELISYMGESVGPHGLLPGEERVFDWGPHADRFFPTLVRINFTVDPFDSNVQNNYAESIYLVWGHFSIFFPTKYIKIKDIY